MVSQIDRQLFFHWRDHFLTKIGRGGEKAPAARVAILGNCQSFSYAYSMKALNPALCVDRYALVSRCYADLPLLTKTLSHYDVVFVQEFGKGLLRDDADFGDLRTALPQIRPLPLMNFAAFHPDTIYIFDPTRNGALIHGPVGVYQSALTLFGYLQGLSVAQTHALFSKKAFDYLGYCDLWNGAAHELIEAGARAGLDLQNDLARWARAGVFMYTPNHPKPQPLFDIARKAMRRANLAMQEIDVDCYLVDDLVRGVVIPVYPPLAAHFGVKGSELFKKEHFHLSRGPGDFLTLTDYIAASFKDFAQYRRPQLYHARVEAWCADEETVKFLTILTAEELKRRANC